MFKNFMQICVVYYLIIIFHDLQLYKFIERKCKKCENRGINGLKSVSVIISAKRLCYTLIPIPVLW